MGFLEFLGGAVKVLFGGVVFLGGITFGMLLLTYGYTIVGALSAIVGLIGGIYTVYERGQQRKRI